MGESLSVVQLNHGSWSLAVLIKKTEKKKKIKKKKKEEEEEEEEGEIYHMSESLGQKVSRIILLKFIFCACCR